MFDRIGRHNLINNNNNKYIKQGSTKPNTILLNTQTNFSTQTNKQTLQQTNKHSNKNNKKMEKGQPVWLKSTIGIHLHNTFC